MYNNNLGSCMVVASYFNIVMDEDIYEDIKDAYGMLLLQVSRGASIFDLFTTVRNNCSETYRSKMERMAQALWTINQMNSVVLYNSFKDFEYLELEYYIFRMLKGQCTLSSLEDEFANFKTRYETNESKDLIIKEKIVEYSIIYQHIKEDVFDCTINKEDIKRYVKELLNKTNRELDDDLWEKIESTVSTIILSRYIGISYLEVTKFVGRSEYLTWILWVDMHIPLLKEVYEKEKSINLTFCVYRLFSGLPYKLYTRTEEDRNFIKQFKADEKNKILLEKANSMIESIRNVCS